jgi:hypothetical protein
MSSADSDPVGTRRRLGSALFFTKEGDLDFGWIILIACVAVGLGVFVAVTFGVVADPSTAAWAWMGSFTTLAFISGATIARARLIAKAKVEVSDQEVLPPPPSDGPPSTPHEPDLYHDDERG